MSKKATLLSVVICTLLLNGCVIAVTDGKKGSHWTKSKSWQQYHEDNRYKIAKLSLGEDYQQVLTDLGTPQFSEQFLKDESSYRIFFYATSRDGGMSKEDCTPVVFKDGVLVGWGQAAYSAIL